MAFRGQEANLRFARCVGAPFSFFRFALLLESFGGLIVSLALFLSVGDAALIVNSACARVFRDKKVMCGADVSDVCLCFAGISA
jgi:hypothetical protein